MGIPISRCFLWSLRLVRRFCPPATTCRLPMQKIVATDSFADEQGNKVPATHYGMSKDFPMELLVTGRSLYGLCAQDRDLFWWCEPCPAFSAEKGVIGILMQAVRTGIGHFYFFYFDKRLTRNPRGFNSLNRSR